MTLPLCDYCQQRDAVVYLTQVQDAEVTRVRLCAQCAAEHDIDISSGAGVDFSALASMLPRLSEALAEPTEESAAAVSAPPLACPTCGAAYTECAENGCLGCADCYRAFAEPLAEVIRANQDNADRHVGKVPESARRELQRAELEDQLRQAVAEERYEEAADLRDRLRAMTDDEGEATQ